VHGVWSLTLANEHDFFHPNDLHRYSLGTRKTDLVFAGDGPLMLSVQADPPAGEQSPNWLPAARDADTTLYLRPYWPEVAVTDGSRTPPVVDRAG
jgi:hypothetical protein